MADTKISALPAGGSLQAGDAIPIVRAGVNYQATPQVVTGRIALVAGQQSYAINFGGAFPVDPPSSVWFEIEQPNSSGELFIHGKDLSSLTNVGVTLWLAGKPTTASNGGYIRWNAIQ